MEEKRFDHRRHDTIESLYEDHPGLREEVAKAERYLGSWRYRLDREKVGYGVAVALFILVPLVGFLAGRP